MSEKLIVSLLPGATEIVAAIGGLPQLVGVSHECDWPPAVRALPRVTATPIDPDKSGLEIHQAVLDAVAAGRSAITVDADRLRTLRPDVIITQQLCEVCAVADGAVVQLAQLMDPMPELVVMSGGTLAGVWEDIRQIGTAIGRDSAARNLAAELVAGVGACADRASLRRSRVIAIEWFAPLFLAGHWVPEMIAAAGGQDVGAAPGSHSTIRNWDEVMALDPDVVLVILCGFDAARGRRELDHLPDPIIRDWLGQRAVVVLDGNAYTSRPGPRLVEGIRLMAANMATPRPERSRGTSQPC